MIKVQKFTVNPIQENTYVVSDETLHAVVIDDGAFYPEECAAIEQYIQSAGLTIDHLLCTHAHFDHIFGTGALYDKFQVKAELSADDAFLYDEGAEQVRRFINHELSLKPAPVASFLKEGDDISFGSHKLHVLATPGHTPGGLCFHCSAEQLLFSGDSLFQNSIGRTDFPYGDTQALIDSLSGKILTLPPATAVLPGHGPQTTVGNELQNNIYFK